MRPPAQSCNLGQGADMSLSTRLDRLEAAMRGRDGRDPPDGPWICRRLIYDPREWEIEEDEAISRMKTDELDRLVAAGKITETDRERVRFIVRRIVRLLNGLMILCPAMSELNGRLGSRATVDAATVARASSGYQARTRRLTPQTLGSLKARHLVTKRPKKKLSHLYFGPVGGGERQDLIRQPRPSASFVERRQFKNAFADQLFPNVIENGF
jgi:hypothetical protein